MDNPFLPFINMFYDVLKFLRIFVPIIVFYILGKKSIDFYCNNDNNYYSDEQIKNRIKLYIFLAFSISILVIVLTSIIMLKLK